MPHLSLSPPALLSPSRHKAASPFHKESPKTCSSTLAEINFRDAAGEGS